MDKRMKKNIYVDAGKKLKSGSVTIRILLSNENGVIGDSLEFDLSTRKRVGDNY